MAVILSQAQPRDMPKVYEYKFVEDFKLPENVSNAQSLRLSNKLYLESKGIKDDFSVTMQYSVCKKHKDCVFASGFSRKEDASLICVESRGTHAEESESKFEEKTLLAKYGSSEPRQAHRAMERDSIPAAQRPITSQLKNYRHENRPESQKVPVGRTVTTFTAFLNNPPQGVEVDKQDLVIGAD